MYKVLVMGGSGMLGHKLAGSFAGRFSTHATVRGNAERYRALPCFEQVAIIGGVEATEEDARGVIDRVQPDVVINAIGVVKQDALGKNEDVCAEVNQEFPHLLAAAAHDAGAKFIGISTDCVFSGEKGGYSELDQPDANDVYGRSKLAGEVTTGDALTLRTSIIGRELSGTQGLLEWFLANRGRSVKGFRRAIFSGFPTCELADILGWLIEDHKDLRGLYHLASEPISKFELLKLIAERFSVEVEMVPDDEFAIDRSLDGSRFRQATGFAPAPWPDMVDRMFLDARDYENWRNKC